VRIPDILRIRRDERRFAIVAALLFVAANAAFACYYFNTGELPGGKGFVNAFRVAGYDPHLWRTLTDGQPYYDTLRHPLIWIFCLPLHWLNCLLGWLTGTNCAVLVVAALNATCATYSALFLWRVCRRLSLGAGWATLLVALYFGLAHVALATVVPDHFGLTQCLLLACLSSADRPSRWLFLLSAGTTLTSGAKVLMAYVAAYGRRMFRPRFLLPAIVVPLLLFLAVGRYCNVAYEVPRWKAKKEVEARKMRLHPKQMKNRNRLRAKFRATHIGKPIDRHKPLLRWTDVTTPRGATVVENLFGESFMLHRDHLLEDVLVRRPVFVRGYGLWACYAVELLLVVLTVAGCVVGRRRRVLRLALLWFALDMVMHLGLGFGINEVYIMTAHWAFLLPVAMACLLGGLRTPVCRRAVGVLLAAIALFLYGYNGAMLYTFFAY